MSVSVCVGECVCVCLCVFLTRVPSLTCAIFSLLQPNGHERPKFAVSRHFHHHCGMFRGTLSYWH